jgi:hypothetical protein
MAFLPPGLRARGLDQVVARVRGVSGELLAVASLNTRGIPLTGREPGRCRRAPPEVLAGAARALQREAARWARLRVGEELVREWRSLDSLRL